MGRSFHPRTFAPAGGAPADTDVDSIAVWRGELETPTAGSGAHLVHGTLLLFPAGTSDCGTGNQQAGGAGQTCPATPSHTSSQVRTWRRTGGCSLQRLTPGAEAPSLAAG